MIPKEKLEELRQAFIGSARPLVFFDDDADGVSSFLQFYKLNREAKGIIYKAAGPLDSKFIRKVREFQPDRLFLLDIPNAEQDFIDEAKAEIYWLDHHSPLERKNVNYYNPMSFSKGKDNRPVSYWSYLITGSSIWLSMAGTVGDWFLLPDLRKKFSAEFPDLLSQKIKRPEDALFRSKIGLISRVLNFMLKGTTRDAMAGVEALKKIENPYEILAQKTPEGKLIWEKYEEINKIYQEIRNSPIQKEGELLFMIYPESKMALTSELSNELLYENPEKFIIVCRDRADSVKCSLRSSKYKVLPLLEKALEGIDGYGGGHVHACGANIKRKDFDRFMERIRQLL